VTDVDRRLVAELISKAECALHDSRQYGSSTEHERAEQQCYRDAISFLEGARDIIRRYI
jgi:hypothetical protein